MKKTIIDLFEDSVVKYGAKTFLLEKKHRAFEPTTYAETREQALETGAGLAAAGIRPGDKVAILSEGCNAWITSELGVFYAGAVSVPLSVKLEESNDLLFRMRHAEVRALFVSKYQLSKIRRIRAELPQVEHIIVIGHTPLEAGETALGTLRRMGRDYLAANREEFLAIGRSIRNDDYATITYTSGTTAAPKGVVLTHRNYTANVEQSLSRIDIPPYYRTLIILPLDHCFAHVVGFYIMIACGATVATVQVGATPMETLKNIPQNIREVRPHFLLSVPALAKNFRKNIESSIRAKGRFTERLFNFALRTAYVYNSGVFPVSGHDVLAADHDLAFLSAGKLPSRFVDDFQVERDQYLARRPEPVPVVLGRVGRDDGRRFREAVTLEHRDADGVVEPLQLRVEQRAAAHEEPEAPAERFPHLAEQRRVEEFYQRPEHYAPAVSLAVPPEATADTLRNGWLHTGDMGYVSEDDFLYVLGRFKSLLIASDGEKYSPEGMEEAIVDKSPYIDQIIVHNNQSPFTGAIVVPNREALRRELDSRGVAAEKRAETAAAILGGEIDRYRAGGIFGGEFPERWLPAGLAIVDEPFTEQNGLVNSTMKVVRNKVEEHFRDRLEYLYTPEGRDLKNPKNLASLKKIVD